MRKIGLRVSATTAQWDRLGAAIDGDLLRPSDRDYSRVARWPLQTDDPSLPASIARCTSPDDVAAVLRFVNERGLPFAVRSGGHSFAGHSRTTGVLIDTSLMNRVQVHGTTATVGSGAQLADVYHALHKSGLAIPAGCGPTVGIAGLTLGGGLGVLGRARGLTCDALTGAEVVLADGTVIRCDRDRDQDLFWALRGAGSGSFGVVTRLTFGASSEPRASAFHLGWRGESAPNLIDSWQRWLPHAPDEIAPALQLAVPARIDLPVHLRILGAVTGGDAQRRAQLRDVTTSLGAPPQSQHVEHGTLSRVKVRLSDIGTTLEAASGTAPGGRTWARSLFVDTALEREVVERLVEATVGYRRAGEARELDLTPMGGAYNRQAPDATAFVHRGDLFLLKYSVSLDDPDGHRQAREWLDSVTAIVAPHATGRAYQNFADPDLPDPLNAYYGTNLPRLIEVKAAYDPGDLFRHDQSIHPEVRPHRAQGAST